MLKVSPQDFNFIEFGAVSRHELNSNPFSRHIFMLSINILPLRRSDLQIRTLKQVLDFWYPTILRGRPRGLTDEQFSTIYKKRRTADAVGC